MTWLNLVLTMLFSWLLSPSFAQTIHPDVIYGKDTRVDLFEVHEPWILSAAKSTVALVNRSDLTSGPDNGYLFLPTVYGPANQLCPEERFYSQPSLAFCSGSLIAPNLVLTAGHCIEPRSFCRETALVFDYAVSTELKVPVTAKQDQVYFCKEVVFHSNSTRYGDYAIIRLDRPVTDRAPLVLSDATEEESLGVGSELTLIGFPKGLPEKVATGGKLRYHTQKLLLASINAYYNNSGSPVFNAKTGHIVGVLVEGEEDFIFDPKKQCKVTIVCPEAGCSGEEITRSSWIRQKIGDI